MDKTKPTQVRQTTPFKATKGGVAFDLQNHFGFVPKVIILQKAKGGLVILNAVLTKEELEKEKIKVGKTLSQALKENEANREKGSGVEARQSNGIKKSN